MDIVELMYLNNKQVNEPIECTLEEEELCKALENMLSGRGLDIFIKLQELQINSIQDKNKQSYFEGFKDAIKAFDQLKI